MTTSSGTSCVSQGIGDTRGDKSVSWRPPRSGDGMLSSEISSDVRSSILGVRGIMGALPVRFTVGRALRECKHIIKGSSCEELIYAFDMYDAHNP